MSQIIKKRRVLAAKIETTSGTPITLSGTDCIFVFDAMVQADIPMANRVATGSLSKLTAVPGARTGKATFSVELAGSGTTTDPLWASVLLPACGWVGASSVYTPTSDPASYHTITIGLYEQGIVKQIAGAMGTVSLEGKCGEPLSLKFEFTGIWEPPVDGSMLALPSYTVVPPRFASATLTIGSFGPKVSNFSIDQGNTIKLAEDVTTASGYSRAVITDRNFSGKLDPELTTVASYDAYGTWIAGTDAALSLVVGSASHNTITVAAPHLQYTNMQEGDRDGIVTNEADFQLNSVSAGDLECSITLS